MKKAFIQLEWGREEITGGCPKYGDGRRSSGTVVEEEAKRHVRSAPRYRPRVAVG
jgi:hypothetical protein